MDKFNFETKDGIENNVEKIAEIFPSAVTEGKINFDSLRTLLGDEVPGDERYEFTWVGKKEAMREAGRPIRKTLRPCPEESKNWEETENLYIEGDNLEALKLLQESYLGKVKMIYIDPPYNTGNDFIYKDDFSIDVKEYQDEIGTYAEEGERLIRNTDTNGRYHSDWCSMMYPRLILARNLLRNDGVIFVSIDDNEQANLKNICDEVFGEKNFISSFIWEKKKKPSFLNTNIGIKTEYVVAYGKNRLDLGPLSVDTTTVGKKYPLNNAGNGIKTISFAPDSVLFTRIRDRVIEPQDMSAGNIITELLDCLEIRNGKNINSFRLKGEWRYSQTTLDEIIENGEEITISKIPFRPNHVKAGGEIKKAHNLLSISNYDVGTNEDATAEQIEIFGDVYFDYTKPVGLIQFLVKASTYNSPNALIMDFFSGSSTTAQAVMQINAEDNGNRKFIMVQLPEKTDEKSEVYKSGYRNIADIGKERIRRAGEMIKANIAERNKQVALDEDPILVPDIGFRVFKIDESNMKDVYYSAEDYKQIELDQLVSNIKEDRTDMDLLFACLLDWGLPLSMPHYQEEIDGVTVHTYNNGDLIACFANNISEQLVRKIASRQPLRAVFRDSSFANSPSKINVEEIFKLLAPNTSIRVL